MEQSAPHAECGREVGELKTLLNYVQYLPVTQGHCQWWFSLLLCHPVHHDAVKACPEVESKRPELSRVINIIIVVSSSSI